MSDEQSDLLDSSSTRTGISSSVSDHTAEGVSSECGLPEIDLDVALASR